MRKKACFDGGQHLLENSDNRILYECDRRLCPVCIPECSYTSSIKHAKNFQRKNGVFMERRVSPGELCEK